MKNIQTQEVIDLRKNNVALISNAIKGIEQLFTTNKKASEKRFINADGLIGEQTYKEFKYDLNNRSFGC